MAADAKRPLRSQPGLLLAAAAAIQQDGQASWLWLVAFFVIFNPVNDHAEMFLRSSFIIRRRFVFCFI